MGDRTNNNIETNIREPAQGSQRSRTDNNDLLLRETRAKLDEAKGIIATLQQQITNLTTSPYTLHDVNAESKCYKQYARKIKNQVATNRTTDVKRKETLKSKRDKWETETERLTASRKFVWTLTQEIHVLEKQVKLDVEVAKKQAEADEAKDKANQLLEVANDAKKDAEKIHKEARAMRRGPDEVSAETLADMSLYAGDDFETASTTSSRRASIARRPAAENQPPGNRRRIRQIVVDGNEADTEGPSGIEIQVPPEVATFATAPVQLPALQTQEEVKRDEPTDMYSGFTTAEIINVAVSRGINLPPGTPRAAVIAVVNTPLPSPRPMDEESKSPVTELSERLAAVPLSVPTSNVTGQPVIMQPPPARQPPREPDPSFSEYIGVEAEAPPTPTVVPS
jgi:hypothetical protein